MYHVGALDPYKHKIHRGEIDYQPQTPTLIPMPDKNLTEDSDLTSSEMLVNMSSSTLEEYYLGNLNLFCLILCNLNEFLAMAIATLMKIIRDPTLSQYHTTVVQAITFTFKGLGIKCVPYIPQVRFILKGLCTSLNAFLIGPSQFAEHSTKLRGWF